MEVSAQIYTKIKQLVKICEHHCANTFNSK